MNQVERLEQLLTRVQQNRAKPRAERPRLTANGGPAAAPALDAVAPAFAPEDRAPPRPVPPARPAPGARGQSPLEAAVAGQLHKPKPPPAAPPAAPARAPDPPPRLHPAAQPRAQAAAGEPDVLAPEPPVPSRPINQVTSKHPPFQASTFGEVLRRSLALRAR